MHIIIKFLKTSEEEILKADREQGGVHEDGRHIIRKQRLEFPQSFCQKQFNPENKGIFEILKEKIY